MKLIKQYSRGHGPALVLYILVTLVMTWPYPLQFQTSLYNWSDSLLNSWTLAWSTHMLLTDPFNLYNANIFYPYSNTLAYSESLVPQAAVAMPIILATDMPALAHNLLAFASFVLAAFGMYLLAFDLTRSRVGGIAAGMIYGFTSYKMMHFAHLQLLSSQWMPLALLYLHKLLGPGRETNRMDRIGRIDLGYKGRVLLIIQAHKIKQAFLFALFFALQALSSFYYAFFIAIAAALYVLYVIALAIIQN